MDFLKSFWILIPIGIYLFVTYGERKHRQTAKIYFWLFVLAFGAIGFIYSWISTGQLPPPCCD